MTETLPTSAPAARLLGFLTVAGVLWLLLGSGAGASVVGAWSLVPAVLLGLAVLTAGVEAMTPRRWLGRLKWGTFAGAVALFLAFVAADLLVDTPSGDPATTLSGPSAPLGPDAYEERLRDRAQLESQTDE